MLKVKLEYNPTLDRFITEAWRYFTYCKHAPSDAEIAWYVVGCLKDYGHNDNPDYDRILDYVKRA